MSFASVTVGVGRRRARSRPGRDRRRRSAGRRGAIRPRRSRRSMPPPAPISTMSTTGHQHRVARVVGPPLDPVLGRRLRPAVLDQRALGGRAADVEVDDVRLADPLAEPRRADHARRRTRLDEVDRLRRAVGDARSCRRSTASTAAAAAALPAQPPLEGVEVALDDRLNVGVEDGGARALVLAPFPRDLGRDRHGHAGQTARAAGRARLARAPGCA